MDFEKKSEIILKMEDKQQNFTMNTPLNQSILPEEFKRIDNEEKND